MIKRKTPPLTLILTSVLLALAASSRAQTALLAWDPNPADNQVLKYNVYQAVGSASLALLGSTTNTTWPVFTIAPNAQTTWCVSASNAKGEGPTACIQYTPPAATNQPPAAGTLPAQPGNARLILVNLVANPGFEQGTNGWTFSGNVELAKSSPYAKASEGTNCLVFNAGNTAPNGSASQNLSTSPGLRYQVTFDAA